jgi:radical SAM superfamily enzyme YgiQ (UPF0313 family)
MPVAPFFDCLCIGEAEAILPLLLPVLTEGISSRRDDLLRELSKLPGIYVPRYPPVAKIKRQWAVNLDDFPVHSVVLTQNTELNDLYLIEIERGCAHGCNFCLVSQAYSPMRFHSIDQLTKQAETGLKYRRRIGLVGPAVTDYPQIEELLDQLLKMGAQLSISSLRITSLTTRILQQMVRGGLRSIALAPEAGSECLRQTIHKGITETQILEAIRMATEKGMQQLKLYFMIGLPQETEEDIQDLVNLTQAGKKIIDTLQTQTRLILNLSPFVPKAGTVFQWMPMAALEILRQRTSFIKNQLSYQGIQVKTESPQWSEVQAVLSRGDVALAKVLEDIDKESLPVWHQTAEKHGLDLNFYAHKRWEPGQKLPWDILDSNTKKLEDDLSGNAESV